MLESATTPIVLPRRVPIQTGAYTIRSQQQRSTKEATQHRQSMTPIDLQEPDDQYVVYVYVNHCSQEKLSVTVQDNMLMIKNLARDPLHEDRAALSGWYDGFSFCFLLPAQQTVQLPSPILTLFLTVSSTYGGPGGRALYVYVPH